MKRTCTISCLLLGLTATACGAPDTEPDRGQPQTTQNAQGLTLADHRVVPILFVPSGAAQNQHALPFIDGQMRKIQRWYAEQLRTATFDLEPAQVVNGDHAVEYYYGNCYPPHYAEDTDPDFCDWGRDAGALWESVLGEIHSKLGAPTNRVYGVFYQHDGVAGVGLGLGDGQSGNFMVGVPDMIEECAGIGCQTNRDGGVAHELGHGFGLAFGEGMHSDMTDPDSDPWTSLMSNWANHLDYPQNTLLSSSLNPERDWLLSSPFFTEPAPLLLTDGGFEDCTAHWTVLSGSPSCSDTAQRSGVSALQLSGGTPLLRQQVVVQAGQTYDLSGWVNIPTQPSNSRLEVAVTSLSASGAALGSFQAVDYTSPTDGWERYALSMTMPANTVNARIEVQGALSGTVYLDDMSFVASERTPVAPTPLDYGIKAQFDTLEPTLKWSNRVLATSFQLQVALDSSFSQLVIDTTTPSPFYKIPPATLNLDTAYFWRVRASNGLGSSNWSDTFSFVSRTAANYFSDEFAGNTIDPAWSWRVQEDPNDYRFFPDGYLELDILAGDLQASDNASNVLLRPAPSGDFEAAAAIDFYWQGPWDNHHQANLLVYQDDQNYIQMGRVYRDGYRMEVLAEINGTVTVQESTPSEAARYVKIARSGNSYQGYYSTDGISWFSLGPSISANLSNLQLGLAAYNPLSTNVISAQFDWLRVNAPATSGGAGVLSSCTFEGGVLGTGWTQGSGDTDDWTIHTGSTPSSSTGPSGADSDSHYAYLETSSGYANNAGDHALLLSPVLGGTGRELTFSYHMYGSNMGSLYVDARVNGGSWREGIWSRTGQQHSSTTAPWSQASVDLGAYSGDLEIRFRGVAAGSYRGDMAIDSIQVTSGGGGVCSSDGQCNDDNECTDDICAAGTCTHTNNTASCDDGDACTTADVCSNGSCSGTPLDCNDNNECTIDSCDPALGCQHADASGPCTDDGDSCTDDICSGGVCTHPDNGSCGGAGVLSSCTFEGAMLGAGWTQGTGDTDDWTIQSGSTPSSSTGPSGADSDSHYAYLETSSGYANTAGDHALLLSPVLGGTGRELTFSYHMYGSNIGSLYVDVRVNGGGWQEGIWSRTGQQHSSTTAPWSQASVDLSAYSGDVEIRFRGVAAGSYRGDMAIDSIQVTGGGGGGCTSDGQCDDGNECTDDVCAAGTCTHTNNVASCNDNDACTTADVCSNGSCSGTPLDCNDNNECTIDSCDPASGCQYADASGPCTDDGDSCTDDICNGGACTHPDNGSCGGAGVLSSCTFEGGALGAGWSQGTGDTDDWTIQSGSTPSSSTGPSGADSDSHYAYLETSSGYANTAGDHALLLSPVLGGTGRVLTFSYHMYGSDIGSLYVDVRVNGGSWQEGIWSRSGQQHSSTTTPWSQATVDLGAYTGDLEIRFRGVAAGSYRGDMAIDSIQVTGGGGGVCSSDSQCNDGNECTDDVCTAGTCTHTNNTAGCNDGNACTTADVCSGGTCSGTPLDCDDNNVCTDDWCSAGVCQHTNNNASCADDGDSCTDDICSGGICTHPDNGSCGGGGSPCDGYCSNPVVFSISGSYNSGSLGTGATCHETTSPASSMNCGGLAGGRQLLVNGVAMTCNYQNQSLPAAVNGGYCFYTNAGDYAWASFSTW